MKTTQLYLLLAMSLIGGIAFLPGNARAQGSLTPSGPPAPTMKSLAQIEPRTPISSLPYTITNPGSYYLTASLTGGTAQYGIVIQTNNVSLDLDGFALIGVTNSHSGILINGSFYNIVIRNGAVTGWGGHGVDGYTILFPRNVTYQDLQVSGNAQDGIVTESASTIRNCQAFNNGAVGIYSAGALIVDCIARQNSTYGFAISGSKMRSCISYYNSTGVYADHSTVEDCDISDNSVTGVEVGSVCQIINNRITDHSNFNGDAILVDGGQNSIIGNMVLNNYFGLNASAAGVTNNCILQNRFITSSSTIINSFNMFPAAEVSVSAGQNFGSTNSLINIIYP